MQIHPFDAILHEYLISADHQETAKSLQGNKVLSIWFNSVLELNIGKFDYFIKKCIIMGFEHKAYERELISKLLSNLYGSLLSSDIIMDGFQMTLNSLEDLILDTPDAVDILSKFIARAIVDEIVPPIFLKQAKLNNKLSSDTIALSNGLVNEKHRIDRLQHVWGPGDLSSVKRLKEEVQLLVEEFLVNEDFQDADRSLRKINAPSFHFQLVKQALRSSFTKSEQDREKIIKLLHFLNKEGLLTTDQIERGYKVCFSTLNDLQLDIPNANVSFQEMTKRAKEQGLLSSEMSF